MRRKNKSEFGRLKNISPATTNQSRSSVHVTRWEPGADDKWSIWIQQIDHANLAHSPQWFTTIHKAYGHTPLYLKAEDVEGQVAVLPAFLVRSRLLGTVVTSMPFLDTGGPCSSSLSLAYILVDSLIEEASRLGAGLIELRCAVEMDLPLSTMRDKVNLVLPLPANPDYLWRQLDAKVRNQVRKAERSGLSVEFGGAEKLDDFYQTFTVNMRDLGSPVHALGFFRAIFDAFGDQARVALVRKGSTPIGGLIALAFKDILVVPWASSLRRYFSLCPNMLLYWETLRIACVGGFRRFDFGRSSRNSNTYRFKRQWGALEEPLFWYTIPIAHNHVRRLSNADGRGALLVWFWQRLPLSVTRWLGPHIRKYLTQ
jgi:FemAB-related protein (PEP-CTERM system-associated)